MQLDVRHREVERIRVRGGSEKGGERLKQVVLPPSSARLGHYIAPTRHFEVAIPTEQPLAIAAPSQLVGRATSTRFSAGRARVEPRAW